MVVVVVVILPVCTLIVNINSKVQKKNKENIPRARMMVSTIVRAHFVLLCGVVVVVGGCHVLLVSMYH